MKVTIRWKMMASYLLLVVLMSGVFYGYLHHTLEQYLLHEAGANLANEARLARLLATDRVHNLTADAPAAAAAIGREISARVTFISSDGTVAGDSQIPGDQLKNVENHAGRPEFREALQNGFGSSLRHSSTLKTPMQYVAVPFSPAAGDKAVLRLALPLSQFQTTRSQLHALLAAAIAAAVLASLLFSYILSNIATRPVKTMVSLARRFGRGDFRCRLPSRRSDELGELAGAMNDMAVKIEGQLQQLAAERNRLDTILRGMGEGLLVTDAKGIVTLVNPAFQTLIGGNDEVRGRSLIEISRHPLLHSAWKNVVATSGDVWQEIAIDRPERVLLTHWVPLIEDGVVTGVVSVLHDITDLRKTERIRRDFVANVSHELRTPVTVIKGYAETLLSGMIDEDPVRAATFVGIIQNHSERLAALIDDLLVISQLESGGIDFQIAPVSVAAVAGNAAQLLENRAREKRITITISGLEALPAVSADRGKIEQVLINLLDNAIKYTPEGGAVTITGAAIKDHVAIKVTDTGIGIPASALSRIFERFYRVDAARSREAGGTGLGLSIVKHIVQGHGGTVDVASTPGAGTTFTFTLPITSARS